MLDLNASQAPFFHYITDRSSGAGLCQGRQEERLGLVRERVASGGCAASPKGPFSLGCESATVQSGPFSFPSKRF